jgi:hypothetical protein
MAWQLPKFLRTIRQEHDAIESLVVKENIQLIISDNRYGCWSSQVPCILITHQSNIQMPKRFGWLQGIVGKLNGRYMDKFSRCWIPDFPDDHSLSGALIDVGRIPIAAAFDFVGWLSRFNPSSMIKKKYDVAAIFSGPEPQRTMLENLVLPSLRSSGLKYFVVRGIISGTGGIHREGIADYLTSEDLQELIESSEVIIARSGYSTIMDLAALKKKAIFIPTPGQTEQEYLAQRLMEKGIAYFMPQDKFDFSHAWQEREKFSGFNLQAPDSGLLKDAIHKGLKLVTQNTSASEYEHFA